MKRLTLWIGLAVVALAGCDRIGSDATVPTVAILNLLSHPILDESVAGIREGLAEAGFDGDAIRIIESNANGEMDRIRPLVQELLAVQPDVFIPVSTPVSQAAFAIAPSTQQVVFSTVTNPDDIGFSEQPQNWTGVSDAVNYEANIDLIFTLVPEARRIGMVFNPSEANSQYGVEAVRRIGAERGFELVTAPVQGSGEVRDAAASLASQVDALYVGSDNTVVAAIASLLSAAEDARVPVVSSDAGSVSEGVPIAVSVDYRALGREVGRIVAELLASGGAAGEIPMVQFLGDQVVTNPSGAARLNMTLPDSLVHR